MEGYTISGWINKNLGWNNRSITVSPFGFCVFMKVERWNLVYGQTNKKGFKKMMRFSCNTINENRCNIVVSADSFKVNEFSLNFVSKFTLYKTYHILMKTCPDNLLITKGQLMRIRRVIRQRYLDSLWPLKIDEKASVLQYQAKNDIDIHLLL